MTRLKLTRSYSMNNYTIETSCWIEIGMSERNYKV